VSAIGFSVWPHLFMKAFTAKDERTIIKALPVCLIGALIIYSSSVPVGLLGRLSMEQMQGEEHYYIALAKHALGPWLGTFAMIGIAAAALSTASTILMVTAQALGRDVYQRWRGDEVSESRVLAVSRLSVLFIGLLAAYLAYIRLLSIFWLIVLSGSLLSAIFFVPIVGGFFSRRANGTAALAAMIVGAAATIVIFVLNRATGAHWFITELFAGLLFSLMAWLYFCYRREPSSEERKVLAGLALPD